MRVWGVLAVRRHAHDRDKDEEDRERVKRRRTDKYEEGRTGAAW